MEKPQSKKAKTFHRFNGTQDHGKAEAVKQHRYDADDYEYFTHRKVKGLARHATQDLRNGLIDYSGLSEDQLEEEADRILREAEENVEDEPSFAERHAPTIAEVGGRTRAEIRASIARAATLDTFENDDFGDYSDSHIKIRNVRLKK